MWDIVLSFFLLLRRFNSHFWCVLVFSEAADVTLRRCFLIASERTRTQGVCSVTRQARASTFTQKVNLFSIKWEGFTKVKERVVNI